MSVEDELLALAREREGATDSALTEMALEQPERLGRQLRAYLSRQVDRGRIKHTKEKIPELATVQGGLNELTCRQLEFSSGARLQFKIQLEEHQRGWFVKQFQFRLHLPDERSVSMVRIHLNLQASHDPLTVPRCHMHIDSSEAHLPFPVMNPLLILHVICERIEADLGSRDER